MIQENEKLRKKNNPKKTSYEECGNSRIILLNHGILVY